MARNLFMVFAPLLTWQVCGTTVVLTCPAMRHLPHAFAAALLLAACSGSAPPPTAAPPAPDPASPFASPAPPSPPPAAPTPVAQIEIPAHIRAAVDAPDRADSDRPLDAGRKPAEMLAFFGIAPGMKVAELSAGHGYTTELLARAVGA